MKFRNEFGRNWLSQGLFILSLLCLGFGLFSLGWRVWPAPVDSVQITIPAGVLPGAEDQSYASLTDYKLVVSWPLWILYGETGRLRVNISGVAGEDPPTTTMAQPQIALLEPVILGLPLTPAGRMQGIFSPDQSLDLTWEVQGNLPGEYTGKVYVAFGFYDADWAELASVPVAVVDVQMRVDAMWGLEANLAMWLGLVGMVLWAVLFVLGVWYARSRKDRLVID
jgi:hypothetical protein